MLLMFWDTAILRRQTGFSIFKEWSVSGVPDMLP